MALIAFNKNVDTSADAKLKVKKSKGYRGVNLLLEPSSKQWFEDPDALVAFNIPRISARLERLMGTNVVRLTDRKYMKELRQRIDEDYRVQLANRIKNREVKELERERNLILEGRTDVVPRELATEPIFLVNKRANIEIMKRRAKLKTNRERNADRLLRQGMKWEKERLRYDRQEYARQQELAKARERQKALEEKYMNEDGKRGLNLLRIKDTEWQECEQSLRDFLESERNKMKARSWAVPTPYSSDPLDIRNIMRAKQQKREKRKLRSRMKRSQDDDLPVTQDVSTVATAMDEKATGAESTIAGDQDVQSKHRTTVYLSDDEASGLPSSTISILGPTDPVDKIKADRAKEMEQQMETDVQNGFLVTAEQFANLRYDDPQIAKLRESKNIRQLYQIAERIIVGDSEEEPMPTEEMELAEEEDY